MNNPSFVAKGGNAINEKIEGLKFAAEILQTTGFNKWVQEYMALSDLGRRECISALRTDGSKHGQAMAAFLKAYMEPVQTMRETRVRSGG